jgi:hypothetical protein
MAELEVAEDKSSDPGKDIPALFRCQENIANWADVSGQSAK